MSPLRFCLGVDGRGDCGALFTPARDDRGRCPTCRAKHNRQRYDTRRAQGYLTRQWTDTAKRFLADHPVCADCGRERSAIAHHLHGLRPHSPGGMDPANLVPVCRSCHAKRHAAPRAAAVGQVDRSLEVVGANEPRVAVRHEGLGLARSRLL